MGWKEKKREYIIGYNSGFVHKCTIEAGVSDSHVRFCAGQFLGRHNAQAFEYRAGDGPMKTSSRCTEDGVHELIIVDLDPPILRAAR